MFRVGDTVRRTSDSAHGITRGLGYVVRHVYPSGRIELDGHPNYPGPSQGFYDGNFRLLEAAVVESAQQKYMAVLVTDRTPSGLSPFIGMRGAGSGVYESRDDLLVDLAVTSERNPTVEYHIIPVRSVAKVVNGAVVEEYT